MFTDAERGADDGCLQIRLLCSQTRNVEGKKARGLYPVVAQEAVPDAGVSRLLRLRIQGRLVRTLTTRGAARPVVGMSRPTRRGASVRQMCLQALLVRPHPTPTRPASTLPFDDHTKAV